MVVVVAVVVGLVGAVVPVVVVGWTAPMTLVLVWLLMTWMTR